MMLSFKVKGSRGDIYEVFANRTGDNLTMVCTCRAGQVGMYCKHRFALLDGDVTRLVSDNTDDVTKLAEMLAGTDVAHYLDEVRKADARVKEAQSELKKLKKALARALND